MKVTGFTIIKNAISLDFPVKEAILSILPVCDDVVVAIGDCNDGTRELIAGIAPAKISVINTVWDKDLNTGGSVLASETDKAFRAISSESDWCFYIQADEVLHERYLDNVHKSMQQWKDNRKVDGLLLKYVHFYGSYDYVGTSSKWYRKEIRIVRNDRSIYSYRDAQGFRKGNDQKLCVKETDAFMYHYGWVREPENMKAKTLNATSIWSEDVNEKRLDEINKMTFDYGGIDALDRFTGTHPIVMEERIARLNWKFDYDIRNNRLKLKDRGKNLLEKLTGRRFFDYENYRILR